MNKAYPLPNLLEFAFFLTAFIPLNLPTPTMHVLHLICSLFYTLFVLYFAPYLHAVELFFCAFLFRFYAIYCLLYFISQHFSFYTSAFFLWHAVTHSYNMMVSFAFFVFVCDTAHCFLLLVSCMLYVVKKPCPEEAHLNRWAKGRQNNKIITRRANLSARYEHCTYEWCL